MELVEIVLSDNEFHRIRTLVYKTTGICLADSKRALVVSRLYKRLRNMQLDSFDSYIGLLETNPDEMFLFINSITTNLTRFYREKNQFEIFQKSILPAIMENKKRKREYFLRIWSAGCSTGEEVYTILFEVLYFFSGRIPNRLDVKILGSDIDTNVLRKARSGEYNREELKEMEKPTVEKFFDQLAENDFRIKEHFKKYLLFKRINLVYDKFRFKEKVDVIFCRNVVIYFDRETKTNLYEKFHAVLNHPGYFFSGHSENLFKYNNWFKFIEKSVYKKVI
jgi:chemotaxis protein methyltransferase CheR